MRNSTEPTDEEFEDDLVDLMVPWEELDPGIAPAVRALVDGGLIPWASCQGGEGHVSKKPFVCVASNVDELDEIAVLVTKVLLAAGFHKGFDVSRVTNHKGSVTPDAEFPSYVVVEFWECMTDEKTELGS